MGEALPALTADLIRQLDELYAKPSIVPGVDRDDLMYRAGQRSVVDRLLWLLKDDEE